MTTTMLLDDFLVEVDGSQTRWANAYVTVRNGRKVSVLHGGLEGTLWARDGEIALYGTPEQLRDLGRAIAEGAESIIKKAADEAAATNDSSMVADAVASVQGGGAGA